MQIEGVLSTIIFFYFWHLEKFLSKLLPTKNNLSLPKSEKKIVLQKISQLP